MSSFVLVMMLVVCQICRVFPVDPVDSHEKHVRPVYQPKRRLSLQNTAEIQSCLIGSGDVGCGTFQCFSNNSCEIKGLLHICHTLLHNAGSYDSQGKWFVKEALRCMALGVRQRFSCVGRRCAAVREMVFSLQRECYTKHSLCLALRDNMDTMGDLVHLHLLFVPGPYVELINFLLGCGEDVRTWIGRRLRAQCSQQLGSLVCSIFSSSCNFTQSDALQHTTVPPPALLQPITGQSPLKHQTRRSAAANKNVSNQIDNGTNPGFTVSGETNVIPS